MRLVSIIWIVAQNNLYFTYGSGRWKLDAHSRAAAARVNPEKLHVLHPA